MSLIVKCVNGHRFPVNLKKHRNRRERFCPRCHVVVQVRKRLGWLPNLDWRKKKMEAEYDRRLRREMQKSKKRGYLVLPSIPTGMFQANPTFSKRVEAQKKK